MKGHSQAALLVEWELLLKAVRADEAELAGIAPFRAALERSVALAVSAQGRRNALQAATQKATRQMNEAFRACSEAALMLRCFVRGTLGPRNERLVRYGIKPIRKRGHARKVVGSCGLPS